VCERKGEVEILEGYTGKLCVSGGGKREYGKIKPREIHGDTIDKFKALGIC